MATEKNITIKQFNGTDYDTLYPKTVAAQIDDVYSKDETYPKSQLYTQSQLYTKEQILTDATKTLYGLGSDAVPDNAFQQIKTLIDNVQASTDGKARIQTGSYAGTGTYGASHPCRLTFDFVPKIVMISCSLKSINTWQDNATTYEMEPTSFYYWGQKTFLTFPSDYTKSYNCTATISDKTLSWFGENSRAQLNYFVQYHPGDNFNETYTYIYYAIG